MPWDRGILNGLSHMLDVLPPDNPEHRMKINDPGIGVPVRHWLYRKSKSYTHGLLVFVKDFKVQSNLYIVHEWISSSRFHGTILEFYNPEELKAKLVEVNLPVPRGFDISYKEMQEIADSSDFRLFLKSAFDMTYGYREFVPIDQIGVYGNTQTTVI